MILILAPVAALRRLVMTVKNNLKRLTLGATMVLGMLISNLAPAQPTTAPADQRDRNRDRGERRTMLLERLRPIIDDLQLSEEQKARVREIVDTAREQMREQLQQMRDLPPRERMERVRDKLQEVREQLGEVLSEDQRVEFDRRVEELQQRRRPEPGGAPATAPATAPAGEARGAGARRVGQFAERFRDAIDQLGLSDEQKAQASRIADDLGKR